MTSILSYEEKIQKLLDINWLQFRRLAKSAPIIEMDEWAQYFAYDVVSELALGRAFGMVKTGSDVGQYIQAVLGLFYWSSNLGHIPGQRNWLVHPLMQPLIKMFGSSSLKGNFKFRQFMTKAVGDRYDSKTKPDTPDMLQHFIDVRERDPEVTFYTVQNEAANVMGAGADTTSIGIRAILYQILAHPDTHRRIQDEIDTFYNRELSDGEEINYKQCQSLPYLQAVIKEALRLHPSIIYQLPRYCPPDGLKIGEYVIPPGWAMGISPRSMNRCKDIFGEDANEFKPDRWLEDESRARYMDSLLATVHWTKFGS